MSNDTVPMGDINLYKVEDLPNYPECTVVAKEWVDHQFTIRKGYAHVCVDAAIKATTDDSEMSVDNRTYRRIQELLIRDRTARTAEVTDLPHYPQVPIQSRNFVYQHLTNDCGFIGPRVTDVLNDILGPSASVDNDQYREIQERLITPEPVSQSAPRPYEKIDSDHAPRSLAVLRAVLKNQFGVSDDEFNVALGQLQRPVDAGDMEPGETRLLQQFLFSGGKDDDQNGPKPTYVPTADEYRRVLDLLNRRTSYTNELREERDKAKDKLLVERQDHVRKLSEIRDVAVRYAKENDLCSRFDDAMEEIGFARRQGATYQAVLRIDVTFSAQAASYEQDIDDSWVDSCILGEDDIRDAIREHLDLDSDNEGMPDIEGISFDVVDAQVMDAGDSV